MITENVSNAIDDAVLHEFLDGLSDICTSRLFSSDRVVCEPRDENAEQVSVSTTICSPERQLAIASEECSRVIEKYCVREIARRNQHHKGGFDGCWLCNAKEFDKAEQAGYFMGEKIEFEGVLMSVSSTPLIWHPLLDDMSISTLTLVVKEWQGVVHWLTEDDGLFGFAYQLKYVPQGAA